MKFLYLLLSLLVIRNSLSLRCLSNVSSDTFDISSSRFVLSPGEIVDGVDVPECEPLFMSDVRIGSGADSDRGQRCPSVSPDIKNN